MSTDARTVVADFCSRSLLLSGRIERSRCSDSFLYCTNKILPISDGYSGNSTVSITWITPLDVSMSVMIT